MRYQVIVVALAFGVAAWAQTASQNAPASSEQKSSATESKTAHCEKMASADAKPSCCAHHDAAVKDAAGCCGAKDAASDDKGMPCKATGDKKTDPGEMSKEPIKACCGSEAKTNKERMTGCQGKHGQPAAAE